MLVTVLRHHNVLTSVLVLTCSAQNFNSSRQYPSKFLIGFRMFVQQFTLIVYVVMSTINTETDMNN